MIRDSLAYWGNVLEVLTDASERLEDEFGKQPGEMVMAKKVVQDIIKLNESALWQYERCVYTPERLLAREFPGVKG